MRAFEISSRLRCSACIGCPASARIAATMSAVSALVSGSTTTSASTSRASAAIASAPGRVAEGVPAEHREVAVGLGLRSRRRRSPRVASTATVTAQNASSSSASDAGEPPRCAARQREQGEQDDEAGGDDDREPAQRDELRDDRLRARAEQLRPDARRSSTTASSEQDGGGEDPAEHGSLSLSSGGMPGIDLHTHSSVSDGTETPAELVAAAVAAGLDVVAITDHDSTAGWARGVRRRRGHRAHRRPGHRAQHPAGLRQRARARLPRRPRRTRRSSPRPRASARSGCTAPRPWSRASRADYALDWDDVLAQTTPGATVGRPHIADALVARGHVPDRTAAFESILHWRGGYYRPHEAPSPVEGVRLIAEAGGAAVIAHPGGRGPERLFTDKRIAQLVDAGLFGLEVDHRDNPPASRARWIELASPEYGLVMTGAERLPRRGQAEPARREHHDAARPTRRSSRTRTGSEPFTG